MIRKSMLIALLGFSLAGCAVYGDSRYGNRYYERDYFPGTYVGRTEVYSAPRVYVYENRRYPPPVYYVPPPRQYAPPPPPRYYVPPPPPPPRYRSPPGYDPRYYGRHDRNSRDYRPAPAPGWEGQRNHYQQQQRSAPLQWQQRETPQRLQGGSMNR